MRNRNTTYFKSEKHKINILTNYQTTVDALPLDLESHFITTSFGKTHVLNTKETQKPPLLLLHGIDSAAPYILDQFHFLKQHYQLFAIDVLGQPNKSDEIRLSKRNDDYALWIDEITSQLSLKKITLLGYSFGAFICLKTAYKFPTKIKKLILCNPAGLVNGNLMQLVSKLLSPLLLFNLFKNDKNLKKGLTSIYTTLENHQIKHLKEIVLGYKSDTSTTPIFKNTELTKIKAYTTLFLADNDILFPADKIITKLKSNSDFNISILKTAKHVFGKHHLKEIQQKLTTST